MARRPGLVTFIGVLIVIQGVFTAVEAIVSIAYRGNDRLERELRLDSGDMLISGITYGIVAIVLLAVGIGLLQGSRFSRVLVAVVQAFNVAVVTWAMFVHHTGAYLLAGAIAIAWALFILWALFNERADEYFDSPTSATSYPAPESSTSYPAPATPANPTTPRRHSPPATCDSWASHSTGAPSTYRHLAGTGLGGGWLARGSARSGKARTRTTSTGAGASLRQTRCARRRYSGEVPMGRIRQHAARTSRVAAAPAAALVLAGLAAGCTGGTDPLAGPAAAAGSGTTRQPASSPARPTATATSAAGPTIAAPARPNPGPGSSRTAWPAVPVPAGLRPVAVPAACELGTPAEALQRSADAGHVPWRLDPAGVVLECLRRDLGTAAWRVRRVGEHTVAVAEARSGFAARVRVEQPARRGPGGIWGIAAIAATAELTLPPACGVPDPAALQASFDQGHQPWRADPVAVAQSCVAAAYGWPNPRGRLVSPDHVLIVDDTIGETADVRGRRWRAGGDLWLVTSVEREIGQD